MWSIILSLYILILESLSKIKISTVILNYLQIKLIIYIYIYKLKDIWINELVIDPYKVVLSNIN